MANENERYWRRIRRLADNLQWFERKEMTSRCGVYILMWEDTPQYIGKSIRVDSRLVTHRTAGKIPFDAVLFAEVAPEFLDDVERDLLLRYDPPKNTIFPAKDRLMIPARDLPRLFRTNS